MVHEDGEPARKVGTVTVVGSVRTARVVVVPADFSAATSLGRDDLLEAAASLEHLGVVGAAGGTPVSVIGHAVAICVRGEGTFFFVSHRRNTELGTGFCVDATLVDVAICVANMPPQARHSVVLVGKVLEGFSLSERVRRSWVI